MGRSSAGRVSVRRMVETIGRMTERPQLVVSGWSAPTPRHVRQGVANWGGLRLVCSWIKRWSTGLYEVRKGGSDAPRSLYTRCHGESAGL
jgi:hypothetical protein